MWDKIIQAAHEAAPSEVCGVLGIKNEKIVWYECKNDSSEPGTFRMNSVDFVSAQLKSKVFALVHSHPDGDVTPSKLDRIHCNALNLDSYIVNLKGDIFYMKPLLGREYSFGTFDCFTLASDYYKQELDLDFKRRDFEEDWIEKGYNYFEDLPAEYGFKEVTDGSLVKNDLILFTDQDSAPNHCGVYTGNGKFIHHARNRLSCEEGLYEKWGRYKTKVLRYESSSTG